MTYEIQASVREAKALVRAAACVAKAKSLASCTVKVKSLLLSL